MVRRGPQTFWQVKIIDKNKLNEYIEPRFKKWTPPLRRTMLYAL